MHPSALHRRFLNDLSTSLFSFVLPLLPPSEELSVKEEVRCLIEKLIKTLQSSARLLSFGSSCNSFGLRNSDMDLVVLIDDPNAKVDPGSFVESMATLLEREETRDIAAYVGGQETNFSVKPLPRARIPILKLELVPSPALPFGIACDIGIENRLAIENTRLLLTYATIDPARVRTLVLFLKVWSKRRRINSPYRGTLSSYGYTLMVLYFLVHVKQPPVLPNLQRIMPMRHLQEDEVMLEGRNVYFFDDVETLRKEWSSLNFESVGELLVDFFRYFSHDFQFNNSVLSLRAGQLTKESKGWVNDIDVGGLNEMARDRNRLCIEDPFEISYNVARTVTKDGLYTLRGEFMRATRILTQRPDRAVLALAELCREREDELQRAPRSSSPAPRAFSASRASLISAPHTYRSPSQATFERLASTGVHERLGRRCDDDGPEYSAQDLWLQSQGTNLGGVQSGSLGLGHDDFSIHGSRGRDTMTRGLNSSQRTYRSACEDHAPPRHISALPDSSGSALVPLSPREFQAQNEFGRFADVSADGSSTWGGYDPRLHASVGMPMGASGPLGLRSRSEHGTDRSFPATVPAFNGLVRGLSRGGKELGGIANDTMYMGSKISEKSLPSAFAPFQVAPFVTQNVSHVPPMAQMTSDTGTGMLDPALDNLGPIALQANFISPSTLLSPASKSTPLPDAGGVASCFNILGIGERDDSSSIKLATPQRPEA